MLAHATDRERRAVEPDAAEHGEGLERRHSRDEVRAFRPDLVDEEEDERVAEVAERARQLGVEKIRIAPREAGCRRRSRQPVREELRHLALVGLVHRPEAPGHRALLAAHRRQVHREPPERQHHLQHPPTTHDGEPDVEQGVGDVEGVAYEAIGAAARHLQVLVQAALRPDVHHNTERDEGGSLEDRRSRDLIGQQCDQDEMGAQAASAPGNSQIVSSAAVTY